MVQNKAFVYKSLPQGWPVEGKDLVIESSDLNLSQPAPKNGLITKNLYASFDPAQRSAMRDPTIVSYSPPMPFGPVRAISAIARVLKSDNAKFKEGDLIIIGTGTEEYSIIPEDSAEKATLLENPEDLPLEDFLGALGMPGLTAYGSFVEIGRPKKSETIFVSAAAGAVGQLWAEWYHLVLVISLTHFAESDSSH